MKKILVSLFILSLFLPLVSSAQVDYGARMERFTVGADFRDGFPRSTTTQELLTGYAWGGDVAGWLQFNPEISRPFLPPQNFHVTASTTQSITLRWDNVQPMDDLQLFGTDDNDQFRVRYLERNLQNQNSYTVQSLQASTTYRFYLYSVDTGPREQILAEAYTPVIQTTTARDDGAVLEEYILNCPTVTENSITIQWTGNIQEQHTASLWGATQGGEPAEIAGNLQPQDSFVQENLQPDTAYQYQIKARYPDNTEDIFPAEPLVCRTAPAQGGQEGGIVGLNITALGQTSLFLNWTDRSRQNRLYDLRRLRITPQASAINSIETIGENSLFLNFTNATNQSADKTPFKQIVERATAGGNFSPLPENQNHPVLDNRPANQNTDYHLTDNNLAEGTLYQYKIKTCATTLVDLRRGGQLQNNLEICAPYSNIVQQATKPNTPTNLTAQVNGQDVALTWNDNSANNDGYEISWLQGNVGEDPTILGANVAAHAYNNLAPGQYVFSLKAFKSVGQERVYSSVATVQAEISQQIVPNQGRLEDKSFLTANIFSIIKLAWQNLVEKTSGFFASAFGAAKKAFALQYQENFDRDYFTAGRQVRAPFMPREFPAAYQDDGLDAGIVYLYRLELLDAGNRQHLANTEIVYGAGETLPAGNVLGQQDVKVCVQNNICEAVPGQIIMDADGNRVWPQDQCNVNADCRNIGSFYTIIKEN